MSMTLDAPVSPARAPSSSLSDAWPAIRSVWKRSSFGAFATVSPDGSPQITPVGSVYLHRTEPRGYYHPVFVNRFRKNLDAGGRFQLLFVDTGALNWLKGLVRGRFDELIAARLSGRATGKGRELDDEERTRWERRVRGIRWTRGYELLWKDVSFVQELEFDAFYPLRFGAMAHGSAR